MAVSVVAWFVTLGIYAFLMFFPFKVVTLNKFEIITPEVKKGELVCFNLDFTKHMDLKPQVRWTLINRTTTPLQSASSRRGVGDHTNELCKLIPDTNEIELGPHKLQVDLSYELISIRPKIEYTWYSDEFQIVE